MVHHEPDRATYARGDHDRIDIAHVIADDDARAFVRDVLEPLGVDAIERVDQHPREEAHQELGNEVVDEQRDRRVHQRRDEKQLRNRQPKREEADRESRGDDHEQRIQNVVRRDDP